MNIDVQSACNVLALSILILTIIGTILVIRKGASLMRSRRLRKNQQRFYTSQVRNF